jgi:hypothetical protein
MSLGVHLSHCYQGDYLDTCKYGEDDCPAKPKAVPDVFWDNWKHDYLTLEDTIEAFIKKRLDPVGSKENVARLLRYHLEKSRELLYAEVNGGLEEEYQEEANDLPQNW